MDASDRAWLVALARRTIAAVVEGREPEPLAEEQLTDALRAPHGAFVTISEDGILRGCMGTLDFEQPLWESVIQAAVSAALRDPRFPPVAPDEVAQIRVEVSVLESPVVLPDPSAFDPQVHGIIVECGLRRALLLPKVAQEQGWDARRTLETVCLKAGLPPDAWRDPAARLSVFAAEAFGEAA